MATLTINNSSCGAAVTTTTTPISYEPASYSLLYNYHTIENETPIAPVGWRVCTISDIVDLLDYLGGEGIAGGEMKSTSLWSAPNTGATNASGFSSIPAGIRTELGIFVNKLLENKIWFDNHGSYKSISTTTTTTTII